MGASENQVMFTADSRYLFQNIQCLTREWNLRVDSLDRLSLQRNGPHGVFNLDLGPSRKTGVTGTDEDNQGESGCQPGEGLRVYVRDD
ncbi:hypothetical protein JFY74_13590 [Pectobacterium carotovorum]|nr:hypothetical protein JFY74_13590 [Pectobacterium carotovorum]